MRYMMELKQEEIKLENMWIDLEIMLDGVDADFTGANGEDFYEDGMSKMAQAINHAETMECEQERIEYVLEKCKEYSEGFYDEFKYTVVSMGNDTWLVTIATMH